MTDATKGGRREEEEKEAYAVVKELREAVEAAIEYINGPPNATDKRLVLDILQEALSA